MFGKLARKSSDLLRMPGRHDRALDSMRLEQGRLLANQNRFMGATLAQSEFSVFSQWGEDGIIQRLVDLVPIAERTFIEFGVESFTEANCRFLLAKDNWRGFVMDGDPANMAALRDHYWFWMFDLQARVAFIDAGNVDALMRESGFGEDLGILSVDLDGNDYWILDAIRSFRPRILITEFNSVFGADRAITVPYDPSFVRGSKHYSHLYWGASLGAFGHWASTHGYTLVHVGQAGVNAFFVRDDVLPAELPRVSVADAYRESYHRESRDPTGALTFVNGDDRLALIAGMPVVDVVSGETQVL